MHLNYWYLFILASKAKANDSVKSAHELIAEISINGHPKCSGVLLRDDIILTTASCSQNLIELYTVRIPYLDPLRKKEYVINYGVESIIIHPKYKKSKKADYNVALIQLAWHSKYQSLARIDTLGLSHSLSTRPLHIIGWERAYNDTPRSLLHSIYSFNSSTSLLCTLTYPVPLNFETEFCLDYQNHGGGLKDRFFDYGSGLFTTHNNNIVLVGLLAWPGPRVRNPQVPVFVRISGVKDWLITVLKQLT